MHYHVLHRNSYPSTENALTLFITEAAPVALAINNTRAGIPNIIIANSDELRYNIFAGPFTKNDQLTAAPFTDSFDYIPDVPFSVANKVLSGLNGGEYSKRSEMERELWSRGYVGARYREWLQEMNIRATATTNLTPGYVTSDVRRPCFALRDGRTDRPFPRFSLLFAQGCPGVGDDTPHTSLPYYSVPDYIGSNPPNVTASTPIDLVFVSFIESDVLSILNSVQSKTKYTSADVSLYTPTLADEVLGLYAQAMWN